MKDAMQGVKSRNLLLLYKDSLPFLILKNPTQPKDWLEINYILCLHTKKQPPERFKGVRLIRNVG